MRKRDPKQIESIDLALYSEKLQVNEQLQRFLSRSGKDGNTCMLDFGFTVINVEPIIFRDINRVK